MDEWMDGWMDEWLISVKDMCGGSHNHGVVIFFKNKNLNNF